jgi:signal transduction histidine kinase
MSVSPWLTTSCASFILIILYRKAVNPLPDLTRQPALASVADTGFLCPPHASDEIDQFVESANRIITRLPREETSVQEMQSHDLDLLSSADNESANGLNGVINYAQLLLESADSESLTPEQRTMLEQIMENSERLAAYWQQVSQRAGG